MTLPVLLSVPHAGLTVPPEAEPYCRLSHADIVVDGDEGAAEIYALREHVVQFVTTEVARAIVDMNRAVDDFGRDGVIKTHTCWDVPVYEPALPDELVEVLLERYHRPYHDKLSTPLPDVRLCVDCHTMAAAGPPVAPDPGRKRPEVCLGDDGGQTLPDGWIEQLAVAFRRSFDGFAVTINDPFSGGHITRTHGRETPWVQLEISRAPFLSNEDKRAGVQAALAEFCQQVFHSAGCA